MATKKNKRAAPVAARLETLRAKNRGLTKEVSEIDRLCTRQSELLRGVAAALYGKPPPDVMWDHSQLPTNIQTMMSTLKALASEPDDHAELPVRLMLRGMLTGMWAKAREGLPIEDQPYPFGVLSRRDHCEVCEGRRGGTPGKEIIMDGVTLCDLCRDTVIGFEAIRQQKISEKRSAG